MKSEYEILRYRPEFHDRIVRLQEQLWSPDRGLNAAYFRWKYLDNPYADDVAIYLAIHRGEVVGMRGFYGSRWEAGIPRQVFSLWCADDLVVAAGHRNRGLFTTIMRVALEDLAARGDGFGVTLSGGELTVLGSLTMGWKSAGPLHPLGLSVRRSGRLRRWFRGPPVERFHRLDRWRPSGSGPAPLRVERDPEPESMAALVAELGHDGRLRHVRDAEYFRWRLRNPLREYRFLYLGSSRLSGYLVLRRSTSPYYQAVAIQVADWEASTPEGASELLRAALSGGRFASMTAWGAALAPGRADILKAHGFRPVEADRTLRGDRCTLIRPLRSGLPLEEWTMGGRNLLVPENWDLRMLYSMRG